METHPQTRQPGAARLARRRLPATTEDASPEVHAARLLFRDEVFRSVLGWLRRLGIARCDRPDLAQDILLSAYTSLPRYDPCLASPRRWINRIAVHVAAHHHERQRHRREVLLEPLHLALVDERPGAEEQIVGEQRRRIVRSWLQALAPEHRALLLERHIEEIPMAEIARRRGIPLSTAYKRHACAVAALMKAACKDKRS